MFNNQNATDMTKQEFIQRAIVKVSDDEFNAINTVYMASNVDKDTFCAMWRKMNSSRTIDSLLETTGIDIFFKQPASVRAEIMARIDAYNNEIKEIA